MRLAAYLRKVGNIFDGGSSWCVGIVYRQTGLGEGREGVRRKRGRGHGSSYINAQTQYVTLGNTGQVILYH